MPKYQRKPEFVEAEIFKLGMEDGFEEIDDGYWGTWNNGNEWYKTGTKMVPYINIPNGLYDREYPKEGDYIIIENGKKIRIESKKEFKEKYDEI